MNNKEFLFIYDAKNCNPNGDPDRDNEPRVDKLTKTNLVTDVRLKRYIRDYFIEKEGSDAVFVSTVDGQKVSPPTRLAGIVEKLDNSVNEFDKFFKEANELKNKIEFFKSKMPSTLKGKTDFDIFKSRNSDLAKNISSENKEEKKYASQFKKAINNALLYDLVKTQFIDIRMFGSAFSIPDYSMTLTGPIQINLGYSLHPVELNSIGGFTTAGDKDGNSGATRKDEVYYSLIAFTGTINGKKADNLKLTENPDLKNFRKALIESLTSTAVTSSKRNQFPKLYIEIEYKDNISGGGLGDLRDLIDVKAKEIAPVNGNFSLVRNYNHIDVSLNPLIKGLKSIEDKISKISFWIPNNLVLEKFVGDKGEKNAIDALKSIKDVEINELCFDSINNGNN